MNYRSFRKQIESLVPDVKKFSFSLARDRDNANDLAQQSLAIALSKADQFKDNSTLKSWLFRIVYTTWIDVVRKNKMEGINMNMDDKFTRVSMFLDGELSNAEMNNVEKIIDKDDDVKIFILNSVKARAYSKSFFRNEMDEDEIILPDNKKEHHIKLMLRAASIVFFIGLGILFSNLMSDRPGLNPAFTDNIINPVYQNILNTALENYKSGVPYESSIPEIEMHITVIPEKTYKYKNKNYIRKFVITYDIGGKTIDVNGFAERKKKELWEIKTLTF